jgi:transposase
MGRSLTIRKPRAAEVRQLNLALEQEDLTPRQKRRAEDIILYGAEMHAVDIARALGVHANTVYADLRAFSHEGVACILHRMHGGAPRRITDEQPARLLSVAEQAPTDLGLPYGRWSLTKLQAFVIKHRIVKAISREALWRVLKKRGCRFAASRGNCSATTPAEALSWPGSELSGGTCPPTG